MTQPPKIYTAPYSIRYLKRQEIDPVKWDACIDGASNGLIYAYSFYLDHMAAQWDALVWNDYDAVMPLTWNKKWGIKYLYQPPLTQQLGVFIKKQIEDPKQPKDPKEPISQKEFQDQTESLSQLVLAFLDEAALHFRFAEIFLNYKNEITEIESVRERDEFARHHSLEPRMNYILHLDASYTQLRNRYSPSLLKNLAATDQAPPTTPAITPAGALPESMSPSSSADATKHGFSPHYTSIFDPAEAIAIYRDTYRKQLSHVTHKDYDKFLKICLLLQKQDLLLVRAVYKDPSRYQLLAVTLLLKTNNRIYLLLPTTLPEGKKKQANHFLLDQLIREFAGQDLILDFEGSDIPGIARFYKKFGPVEQPYFFYRFNHLPWPLRLFKNRK
jgi:hypothetical protein